MVDQIFGRTVRPTADLRGWIQSAALLQDDRDGEQKTTMLGSSRLASHIEDDEGAPKTSQVASATAAICRFAEPLAMTSVFPYLPEMMEYLGVQTDEIASYAGLVSAIFSLCQSLTGVLWGRASDVYGRKPAILVGLACLMGSSVLFGFSGSVKWALLARGIAGLSSGNVGIIRTTVAEMVPQKELQPRAFSLMPLVWTIGSIFGPALGGALANPAKTRPGSVPGTGFFARFPYALPNLVVGAFFLVGLVAGTFFLQETLESRQGRRDYGLLLGEKLVRMVKRKPRRWTPQEHHDEETTLLREAHERPSDPIDSSRCQLVGGRTEDRPDKDGRSSKTSVTGRASLRDVFTRQSSINLVVYTLLALHGVTFDQLLAIFMHHPRQSHVDNPDVRLPFRFAGGFGLESHSIGWFFTLYGVCGMLTQILVFPPVARRCGVLNCLKVSAVVCPLIYLVTPFIVLVEDRRTQNVLLFSLMIVRSMAVLFAFPCSTILMSNSASSLRVLGTLNGVATSISALGRTIGPAVGGATFTWGVRLGYVIMPWWTVASFAAIGIVPIWFLVEMDGPAGHERKASVGASEHDEADPEYRPLVSAPEDEDEDQEEEDHMVGLDADGSGLTTTTNIALARDEAGHALPNGHAPHRPMSTSNSAGGIPNMNGSR